MRILLTCGYNQSLHTIALIDGILKQEHEIVGCIIVKTLQISRIKFYLKQFGLRVVLNKIRNNLMGIGGASQKETYYIKEYLKMRSVQHKQ